MKSDFLQELANALALNAEAQQALIDAQQQVVSPHRNRSLKLWSTWLPTVEKWSLLG